YRESSSYYSVGVTLANVDPKAKEHKVEVATTRPGVTVRARRGYAPKSPDETTRDRAEMALLNPNAKGDFPVAVAIGATKKGGGLGRRLAPYEVRIPMSALTFEQKDGKRTATVDIALAAIQDNGTRSGITPRRNTISVPDAEWDKAKDG